MQNDVPWALNLKWNKKNRWEPGVASREAVTVTNHTGTKQDANSPKAFGYSGGYAYCSPANRRSLRCFVAA